MVLHRLDVERNENRRNSRVKFVSAGVVALMLGSIYIGFDSWVIRSTSNQPRIYMKEKEKEREQEQKQDTAVIWIPPKPDPTPHRSFLRALQNTNLKEEDVLIDCRITSQLSLDTATWTVQTYDIDGNAKTVGGDEFYISFYRNKNSLDTITAASNTTDHGNGTYSLHFIASPWEQQQQQQQQQSASSSGEGGMLLMIWLEYSCGVGAMERPLRDGWSCNGATVTNWNVSDIPHKAAAPPIQSFERPFVPVDLGQFRSVLGVGDSVTMNFLTHYKSLASSIRRRAPLLESTAPNWLSTITSRLNSFYSVHNLSALVMGSASMELQSPYGPDGKIRSDGEKTVTDEELFDCHLRAVRHVLTTVREQFPSLPIVWRLGQAIHLHNAVGNDLCVKSNQYLSQSRTFRLYQMQKDLMAELSVPTFDLYQATYLMADRHKRPGDAIHYDSATNVMMMSWFYPTGGVNESVYQIGDILDFKQSERTALEPRRDTHDVVGVVEDEGTVWIPDKPDEAPRRSFLIALENTTIQESDVIGDCPITAQLSLDTRTWTMQTFDTSGTPKTVGGDEFYISFRDKAAPGTIMAASNTTDHGNGKYSLSFTTSPWLEKDLSSLPKKGLLVVWLEYSCGVGAMERPLRDEWSYNGATLINWNATNIPRPPMKVFQPPEACIDLGQHRSVLAVGDSIMQQFVAATFSRFHYKNLAYVKNPSTPLFERTEDKYLVPTLTRLKAFFKVHNRTVLMMGTAVWELQSPYGKEGIRQDGDLTSDEALFATHIAALRHFVRSIREKFPTLPILWKLGQAVHLHEAARGHGEEWRQIKRLEYMSQSRTYKLYLLQKDLMAELGIPVIDLFEATFLMADRHRDSGDAIHYDIETNVKMISWNYPQGGVNQSIYPPGMGR